MYYRGANKINAFVCSCGLEAITSNFFLVESFRFLFFSPEKRRAYTKFRALRESINSQPSSARIFSVLPFAKKGYDEVIWVIISYRKLSPFFLPLFVGTGGQRGKNKSQLTS